MEHTLDNTLTLQDMLDKSYTSLNGEELTKIYSNTTITGKYFYNNKWYTYKVNSFENGTVKGTNDVNTYDEGRWKVNKDNSMSIEWDNFWEGWSGVAYKVDDLVMFFDSTTGAWRTTYTIVEDGELATSI